ncbi:MAG: hypothetical protein QW035_01520 [Candidatus Anstonellales archaeon]
MEGLNNASLWVGLRSHIERKAIRKASRLLGQELAKAYLGTPYQTRRKVSNSFIEGKLSKKEFEAVMNYLWKIDSVKDLLKKGKAKVVGEGFRKAVIEAAEYARMGKTFSLGRGEGFMKKGPIEEVLKNPEMYSKEAVLKAEKTVLKEAGLEHVSKRLPSCHKQGKLYAFPSKAGKKEYKRVHP